MDVDAVADGDATIFPAVVPLNVGGARFAASLVTLRGGFGEGGDAGSMIWAMFSGRLPARRDEEGRFFIDRDGRHFHHILNYLRDGSFPVALGRAERQELEREAAFYGLQRLVAHLRADLPTKDGLPDPGKDGRIVPAVEAIDWVLNKCLDDWPEFPQYVQYVLDRVLDAGGVTAPWGPDLAADDGESPGRLQRLNSGVVFDEFSAASLQADWIVVARVELAHTDVSTKTWRWSDRKTGVNSVLRAKLLRCHLLRLGYSCQIVPVHDRQEASAYFLQVALPFPG